MPTFKVLENSFKTNIQRTFVLLVVASLLTACGPKKPLISTQQIDAARQSGELVQLYNKIMADQALASGSKKEELTAIAANVATLIAQDKQQTISANADAARLAEFSVVPLATLNQLKAEAAEIEPFDAALFKETLAKLTRESTRSQDALSQQVLASNRISVSDQVGRLNALGKAAQIAGEGSEQYIQYQQRRDGLLLDWMVSADQALANRQFAKAAEFLSKVIGVDPDNQEAAEKLQLTQQQGFETEFRTALENSKPVVAFNALLNIAETPLFEQLKPSLAPNIQLLNDFFINRALQTSSQGALKQAYVNFRNARRLNDLMGQPYQQDAEYDYLRKLMNLADARRREQKWGEQLAYLEVVRQFNADYPRLQATLAKAHQAALKHSATQLFVADFSQTGTEHSAGKSVAKKTFSWVYEQLAGDVVLVTDPSSMGASETLGPLYRLEGDILQAGVDTDSNPGQKTMRVVTKTVKTETKAYQEWVEDGSEGSPPTQYDVAETTEDVTVNVNYVKKTGILSVGYRLVNLSSGTVEVNQSARDKQTFEAESNSGISLGEFQLAAKRAELPSDIEIMEQLSIKVAEQLGDKLKAMMQNRDVNYEQRGDQALAANRKRDAMNWYAYAFAIRNAKGGVTDQLASKLADLAMRP